MQLVFNKEKRVFVQLATRVQGICFLNGVFLPKAYSSYDQRQARSQPVFSGKPGMISRDHFVCTVPSFSEMKEIG